MRNLTFAPIGARRDKSLAVIKHFGSTGDHTCGVFHVPSPIDGAPLRCIASAGSG